MTTSELVTIDTNVLVYAHDESSRQHAASLRLITASRSALALAPQVVAEFLAVVTNPRRVSAPYSPEEAAGAIEGVLALPHVSVLPVPVDIVDRLIELLRTTPVRGTRVFDLQLAAVLLGNGIDALYTFNLADFRSIPGLLAQPPESDG